MGCISIDDVIQQQAGNKKMPWAGLDINTDMFLPITSNVYKRDYWLGISLIAAFLAAWVIDLFDAVIEQLIVLAVLMPVVVSMRELLALKR